MSEDNKRRLVPKEKIVNRAANDGTVMMFPLAGRLDSERERLFGMTDEDREYRKQYLKDQILDESEPRHVPEERLEFMNPIRRFYRYPLDRYEDMVRPLLGQKFAMYSRFYIGKLSIFAGCVYVAAYYLKYGGNDWTRRPGWRYEASRGGMIRSSKDFPNYKRFNDEDYCDDGFKKSPFYIPLPSQ